MKSCLKSRTILNLILFLLSTTVLLSKSSSSSKSSPSSSQYHRYNNQQHSQLPQRKPISNFKSRSACDFFIWDGISALKYKLCNRLLRDRVYEGLGGKKFVRIKPGSILEVLYPPSQYGPDKCLICGHSFHNHLVCWWYSMLYTPYDLYLDKINNEGVIDANNDEMMDQNGKNNRRDKQHRKKRKKNTNMFTREEYESGLSPLCTKKMNKRGNYILGYHRRYVKDLSNIAVQESNRESSTKINFKSRGTHQGNESHTIDESKLVKQRMAGVTYAVPKINVDKKDKLQVTMLIMTRSLVLERLDSLLWVQRHEMKKDVLKSVSVLDKL
mmetsp:Transcript_672/g.772  ORF Transcript_672/g.772 Transcript_672/m.772 type:complete len:327 (+) Transcript_672:82-1062(+)